MQLFMLFIDSNTLYMFRASPAHHQELRNCVCSVWYCHVALCNDRQYNFVCGAMVNVVQYNVGVYWLWESNMTVP
jgi:hypothetical protein